MSNQPNNLDKYQKLIMQHAYYSDLIKDLKSRGGEQSGLCLGIDLVTNKLGEKPPHPLFRSNRQISCIQNAIDCNNDANVEGSIYGGLIAFQETWDELVEEGLVCQHCIEVRRLKRERMSAIAHMGAVRAAMTKMGRKLAQGGAA